MQVRRNAVPPPVYRSRRRGPPISRASVIVNRMASCPRGINDYRMGLTSLAYRGQDRNVRWEGHEIDVQSEFERFVGSYVPSRLPLADQSFRAELKALAGTGVATEFVDKSLRSVPAPQDWEVGEALAECLLGHDPSREVHWPWNRASERRTPRGSSPGPDLVGFARVGGEMLLLFGEVKTSANPKCPPSVMKGSHGMESQLVRLALRHDIGMTLLNWLRPKCQDPPFLQYFQESAKRYLESEGRVALLVGALIRDTHPDERDLAGSGASLKNQTDNQTRIDLVAWYLPTSIASLPVLVKEASQ